MSQRPTLSSIFEATKEQLVSSLSELKLPKDSEQVQIIISEYLNHVCDEDSEYRQNLTQSEDYILQAALSMLNAQKDLVSALDVQPNVTITQTEIKASTKVKSGSTASRFSNNSTLFGAAGGAIAGKLIMQTGWGAVFGAIAGTAVALYLSPKPQQNAKSNIHNLETNPAKPEIIITDKPVDSERLLMVIAQICDSLDNLIETFRAQIKRVVNKYESQEKPTIEREYRVLLEGIQSLIGYKRGHSPEEEKYLSKLQTRVEDLAELLDNYSLETVDFTPDHADWFEAIESKNTTEIKMINPAIIKDGALIIKGKIFIPKS